MARELTKPGVHPAQEEIKRRAQEIFVERGRPEGHDLDHWLAAEAELKAASQPEKPAISAPQTTKAPPRQPMGRRV